MATRLLIIATFLIPGCAALSPICAQDIQFVEVDDYIDPRFFVALGERGGGNYPAFLAIRASVGGIKNYQSRPEFLDNEFGFARISAAQYFAIGDTYFQTNLKATAFDWKSTTGRRRIVSRLQLGVYQQPGKENQASRRIMWHWEVEHRQDEGLFHEAGLYVEILRVSDRLSHGQIYLLSVWRPDKSSLTQDGRARKDASSYSAIGIDVPVRQWSSGSSLRFSWEMPIGILRAVEEPIAPNVDPEFEFETLIAIKTRLSARIFLPGFGTWLHIGYSPAWVDFDRFHHEIGAFLDVPIAGAVF